MLDPEKYYAQLESMDAVEFTPADVEDLELALMSQPVLKAMAVAFAQAQRYKDSMLQANLFTEEGVRQAIHLQGEARAFLKGLDFLIQLPQTLSAEKADGRLSNQ